MFHIVDDNQALRELLAEVMQELGHRVRLFACPLEYVAYMHGGAYEKPVAIFTDVKMPRMNGFELISSVQEQYSDMKFVVMSGYTDHVSDQLSQACLVLSKPFQIELLEKMTEALIRCHHGQMGGLSCNRIAELKPLYAPDWQCPHAPSCSCV